jgi:hypothetical protein
LSRRRVLPLLILLLGVGGFLVLKATRHTPPPVEPRERLAQARSEVEKELLEASHDREALDQERELVRLAAWWRGPARATAKV